MLDFFWNAVLFIQVGLLLFAVFMLYVNIEILRYKESVKHGTDLPEGLPKER